MVQWSSTTTADVLICFQQNPGTADGVEIIKTKRARTWGDDEDGRWVQPNNKGFYGLRIGPNQSRSLEIFETTYRIHRLDQNLTGHDADVDEIVCWDGIWSNSSNHKVQHCLQLLGYYSGPIDGILARKTEEALLAFQADNKLPTRGLEWLRADIEGDGTNPNGNAVNEIVSVVNSKNKIDKQGGGAVYLIRKSLLRFTRAPTANPNEHFGPAVLGAPDVDDRGSCRAEANGHKCRGPITSYSFDPAGNNSFRVKVIRDGIADDVSLVAESENPNIVSMHPHNLAVASVALPDDSHNMNLIMRTGDPGGQSKKIRVFIKWRKPDNSLITIATLRVIVLRMITPALRVRPYRVAIGNPARHAATEPAATKDQLKPLLDRPTLNNAFNRVNDIWRPYGIKFNFLGERNVDIDLTNAGKVTFGIQGQNEQSRVFRLGNEQDKINVFIVREIAKLGPAPPLGGPRPVIQGPFGATRSPIVSPRLSGILLQCRTEGLGWDRTGDTLAHELGHWLALAHNSTRLKRNRRTHVEDDPDKEPANRKKDIWTIRRLMLGTRPDVLTTHGWAHRVGYSGPADPPHINGKMISVRNLSKDKTDNECEIARKRARHRNVYHA